MKGLILALFSLLAGLGFKNEITVFDKAGVSHLVSNETDDIPTNDC